MSPTTSRRPSIEPCGLCSHSRASRPSPAPATCAFSTAFSTAHAACVPSAMLSKRPWSQPRSRDRRSLLDRDRPAVILSLACWQIPVVPLQGGRHDLAEGRLVIDFVMAIAFQDHQALGLQSPGIELFGFLRRHQPVVIGGDEEDWPRRNLVDNPFGMEAERIIDVFEWNGVDRPWIVTPGRGRQLGRLPIGEEDLTALDEFGFSRRRTPLTIGFGASEQIKPLVWAPHAAHPTTAMADPHHTDDTLRAGIDGAHPADGGAAVTG